MVAYAYTLGCINSFTTFVFLLGFDIVFYVQQSTSYIMEKWYGLLYSMICITLHMDYTEGKTTGEYYDRMPTVQRTTGTIEVDVCLCMLVDFLDVTETAHLGFSRKEIDLDLIIIHRCHFQIDLNQHFVR